MDGDSGFSSVTSVAITKCSEMATFPRTVALSTELLGRNSNMTGRVMAALAPIMSENQLVEAKDRFPLKRKENLPIIRMCFHGRQ